MDELTTVKRLHYFDHQFLRADDFSDEQSYHVTLRRLHNQLLHSWGIADGLDVSFQGGATSVTVASGVALDSLGREIVVPADQPVELASFPADKALYLTIAYDESDTDETVETGASGKTRTTEGWKFAALQNQPGDPGQQIVLGVVQRTGTEVTGLDKSGRRSAGAAGGSLDVLALGFRDPNIVSTGWVRMRLEAANRALLQGTLHISAALTVDGDASITGNVAVGAAAAGAPLDVRGAARVGSLALTDAGGAPYADGSIGMANNLDAATKWLQIGGITDGGQRRIALVGTRTYVSGALGIGVVQPAQSLHSTGNAILNNAFVGDVGLGAGWSGFSHSAAIGQTSYAVLQSNDGRNTFLNKRSGGGSMGFRVDNNQVLTMLDTGFLGVGTTTPAAKLQVTGGAIMPASGNAETAGIQFPSDPGGGAGDRAFIRHFPETGETTRLRIGVDNDADDRLSLWQMGADRLTIYNGLVGINQQTPTATLHVQGTALVTGNLATSGMLSTGGPPPSTTRNPYFQTGEVHVAGPGGGTGGGWSFGNRETPEANVWDNVKGNRWVIYSSGNVARLWTAQTGDRFTIDGDGNAVIAGRLGTNGWPNTPHHAGWGGIRCWDLEAEGSIWTAHGIYADGGKGGYVVDHFINNTGDSLEEGDVVVIAPEQAGASYGLRGNIPIPEVDPATVAYDRRVCGIVSQVSGEMAPPEGAPKRRSQKEQPVSELELQRFHDIDIDEMGHGEVKQGQVGEMVTLGAFSHCKVDAAHGAIEVGDLLTTSTTPGHAMKVTEPERAVGAIIAKALAPVARGKKKIPVIVLLQ